MRDRLADDFALDRWACLPQTLRSAPWSDIAPPVYSGNLRFCMHPKIPTKRVSLVAVCAGLAMGCASTPTSAPPEPSEMQAAVAPEPAAARPAPAPSAAPAPSTPATGLRFRVAPTDAVVIVDDEVRGTVAELSGERDGMLPVPPGLYQVSIKRAGYQTWRGEVAVGDTPEVIDVTLEQKR